MLNRGYCRLYLIRALVATHGLRLVFQDGDHETSATCSAWESSRVWEASLASSESPIPLLSIIASGTTLFIYPPQLLRSFSWLSCKMDRGNKWNHLRFLKSNLWFDISCIQTIHSGHIHISLHTALHISLFLIIYLSHFLSYLVSFGFAMRWA